MFPIACYFELHQSYQELSDWSRQGSSAGDAAVRRVFVLVPLAVASFVAAADQQLVDFCHHSNASGLLIQV